MTEIKERERLTCFSLISGSVLVHAMSTNVTDVVDMYTDELEWSIGENAVFDNDDMLKMTFDMLDEDPVQLKSGQGYV